VIPRGSKHREAAWEFVKFAASREQMLRVCKLGSVAGRIPARRSAATASELYGNPRVRPFVDQIARGRTTPVAPGYREVASVLSKKIEAALKGQLSPQVALRAAAQEGQDILDEANEDVRRYPLLPWSKLAVASGLALALAFGGTWWYVRRHTRGSRMARREAAQFYLFLSPWLIGFVVLTLGSTLTSLLFSFSRWDILSPARFVGLANFAKLVAHDPSFLKALGNTLYYAAFSIPLAIAGGLAISVLMNQKLRGIGIYRTVYYLPVVVSGVATALLWKWIFDPKTGLFNKLLSLVVAHPPGWLLDPNWSKPAFIIMGLWGVGGAMVIYLAGLQGIPEELYEAAKIDGATAWQRFRSVTLPLLTPAIFYQLVIGTMAAFQFFTPAYIMTGGGPEDSTLFYNLYLFRNAFEWMKMGYASALAWILFAIILGITTLQFKGAGRWVYYEGKIEE
jgi:multiple sugar transport system permease protein